MDTTTPLAPQPLTMDRLDETEDLVIAQSTSQCCRCCCFQPSINWVMAQGNNFQPGSDPFTLDSVGWIHEESTFCGRWWSWILPGCRKVKYVQHHGPAPASILGENQEWFRCQTQETTKGLDLEDIQSNIVATHEKNWTCGYCFNFGDLSFPICNCFPLPYLETRNSQGTVIGQTRYVCDACCFVPKLDVVDAMGEPKWRLRPDTCCAGICVRCRCGTGKGGKCFRVPFLIRHPVTKEPLHSQTQTQTNDAQNQEMYHKAQIDVLWAGWKHVCCTQQNAYHVAFPEDITAEDKLLLMGSTVLVDLVMFEQKEDN